MKGRNLEKISDEQSGFRKTDQIRRAGENRGAELKGVTGYVWWLN